MIEIMAREIRPAAFSDAHAFAARERALVLAREVVRSLRAAGFAIVPKEPSEEMSWAGWRAKDAVFSGQAEPMRDPANCYRAMVAVGAVTVKE